MAANEFIPECYIDTNLVETFLEMRGVNHQKGCNVVGKVMKEKFSDRFAVGIIDADKRPASYSYEFDLIAESKYIKLMKHPQRPHYMIVISPAMDGFVLKCAEEAGLDISRYGFSPTLEGFISQTKTVSSKDDYRFRSLFAELQHHGEACRLKKLLEYLNETRYGADVEVIKNIIE